MRSTISPEPALLGLLRDSPLHGYELYKQVRSQLGLVWRIEISQMYAILNAFAARGWVGTRVQSQDRRPAKKILELTPAGRRAFDEWMHQPAHGLREFRVDFFLRLYFARAAGTHAARNLIAQQMAFTRREIKAQQAQEAATRQMDDVLIRDFRIQQSKAILRWLEGHREQLARSPATFKSLSPIRARETKHSAI